MMQTLHGNAGFFNAPGIDTANLTREEARRRAEILHTESYDVVLDVAGPDTETFTSRTTIRFSARSGGLGAETFVDIQADSINWATLNGNPLDISGYDGNRLAIPAIGERNKLIVDAVMRYSHTGEGLHRFVDPVDNEVYLYSQFEVADARRVYANFEQPDLKATFTFTVTAPAHWKVFSNAPTPKPQDRTKRDGMKIATWRFKATDRISTYLTALVAGPYKGKTGEVESADGRIIPLGVYTRASIVQHLDPKRIMEITRAGFEFYESRFNTTYPFEKLDQIFVPDFNAGAMENVACITYRDSYVFRSKVSEAVRERRVVTILHELAHMWFGNLVTMRWWNDLWLNESFAEFMSTLATAEATEYKDAWVTFTAHETAWALKQDQLPSTHPIVAPIDDFEDVFVNFDGITYAKGAAVLDQLQVYVGRENFFAGLKQYFEKHAWGNTELNDLLVELEAASGRDLSAWSKVWLEEAGVTVLRPRIKTDDNDVITSCFVEQTPHTGRESLRPHRLALGAYRLNKKKTALDRVALIELDVTGERTEVPELVGTQRPDLLIVNDQGLSYGKVRLGKRSLKTVMKHVDKLTDPLARTVVLGVAWDMVRDAELSATQYLELALKVLPVETQSTAMRVLLANMDTAINHYLDPYARDRMRADIAEQLLVLTQKAEPYSDAQLQLARGFMLHATTDAHMKVIRNWYKERKLPEGLFMDDEARWRAVQALAAAGEYTEKWIAREEMRDATYLGKLEAATARAARPGRKAKQFAFDSIAKDDSLSNAMVENLLRGFMRMRAPFLMEPLAEEYFELLDTVWQERQGEMARVIVEGLFPIALVGDEPGVKMDVIARTQEWLDANPDAPSGQRRLLIEALSEAERVVAARKLDAEERGATRN